MSQTPTKIWQWIVQDTETLGGAPRVKGTRLSVSFILNLLSSGVTPEEIADQFPPFPKESIPEVLKFASVKLAS